MADNDEDELDYSEDEPESSGFFRWLQVVIVMCALGGFFGLAWYAYKSDDTVDDKDVELIKVEKTPAKQAPSESEKQQVPNQDKTVYNLMNSGKAENAPVVERIMPSTEEPKNGTETWASDKMKNKGQSAAADNAKQQVAANTPPVQEVAPAAPQEPAKKPEQFNPAKIRAENKEAPPASAPALPAPPPVKQEEKPKPEAKPAEEKQVEDQAPAKTEEAPKPANPAALPKVRIQLGAYQSNEEAEQEWGKISRKFANELSGKQHYVVRVEIEDKGTFYRLQAAPFASAKEAEALCVTLVGAEQPCFLAKGK